MSTDNRYKTLISGTLVQLTAFSIGGCDPHGRVDSPVARDGADRLTLRGSGIAGAFNASARRLIGGALAPSISAGTPGEQAEARRQAKQDRQPRLRLPESLWRFHTSHPDTEPWLEVRSGVGIRQDTGAAAEGLKYEVETVPAGTHWPFLLEVDDYRDPDGDALAIALHVVADWEHACHLGRNVARGLGWMRIDPTSLRVIRLEPADALLWPDAERSPKEAFDALAGEEGRLLGDVDLAKIREQVELKPLPRLIGTGTINIHPSSHGQESAWGLDTLSLGGSDAQRVQQEQALETLAKACPDDYDPDLVMAWTRRADAKRPIPILPGSGLRGPMRHQLSWWLRSRERRTVHDPNTGEGRTALARKEREQLDCLERLFGSGSHAGALLLSDAEPTDNLDDDAVLLFEQHAEDEFTGGTYAEAKFNRLALVRGIFRFHYEIEADNADELAEFRRLLGILGALGEARQVPIGGANWRGHGWVRWELDPPVDDHEPDTHANQEDTP